MDLKPITLTQISREKMHQAPKKNTAPIFSLNKWYLTSKSTINCIFSKKNLILMIFKALIWTLAMLQEQTLPNLA
jgi:hypothetical protein